MTRNFTAEELTEWRHIRDTRLGARGYAPDQTPSQPHQDEAEQEADRRIVELRGELMLDMPAAPK